MVNVPSDVWYTIHRIQGQRRMREMQQRAARETQQITSENLNRHFRNRSRENMWAGYARRSARMARHPEMSQEQQAIYLRSYMDRVRDVQRRMEIINGRIAYTIRRQANELDSVLTNMIIAGNAIRSETETGEAEEETGEAVEESQGGGSNLL